MSMIAHPLDVIMTTNYITMIVQAAELGDTGRQVVLWVAMGLALWQLLMFAASTFVQGKDMTQTFTFTLLQGLSIDQPCVAILW